MAIRSFAWASPLCAAFSLAAAALPAVANGGVPSGAQVSGFVITQNQGEGTIQIRSGQAVYEGQDTVALTDVTAQLTEKGVVRVSVVGKRGRYEGARRLLVLEGSVTAVTSDGYRLSCPSVEWDGSSGVLAGSGGINMVRDGLLVRGPRFEHSAELGRTVIRGGVTATMDLSGRGR